MPKVTVHVSAELKARMEPHRDRYNWSAAARAAWESIVQVEEEREACEEERRWLANVAERAERDAARWAARQPKLRRHP